MSRDIELQATYQGAIQAKGWWVLHEYSTASWSLPSLTDNETKQIEKTVAKPVGEKFRSILDVE